MLEYKSDCWKLDVFLTAHFSLTNRAPQIRKLNINVDALNKCKGWSFKYNERWFVGKEVSYEGNAGALILMLSF